MLVIMKNDATEAQVDAVIREIERLGYRGLPIPGAQRTAVCIVGNQHEVDDSRLLSLEGVKETIRVTKPYKLVSRETHPQPTVISCRAGHHRRRSARWSWPGRAPWRAKSRRWPSPE